jgi:hypothetical protein
MPFTADQLTDFPLSTGQVIRVPTSIHRFPAWRGESPGATYGGKQVLDWRGRPAFAELAILWGPEASGWTGVWVDSFSQTFRRGYRNETPLNLPADQRDLLRRISHRERFPTGRWDVFCWQGDDVLFVESKRKAKDRFVRRNGIGWRLRWVRQSLCNHFCWWNGPWGQSLSDGAVTTCHPVLKRCLLIHKIYESKGSQATWQMWQLRNDRSRSSIQRR